jgi:pyruvate/2-oxoglutarate dehydrogenase complex dihydrolipoamide acyltransferase (E2) component
MPQLGESVAEGTVVRWLKRVGDAVALDEPLFEVASDKVNMEIPSLNAGRLAEILVPEGATVDVGTPVARIESADDVAAPPKTPHRTPEGRNGARRSPVVRRLAREHQLDLAQVPGTGSHGRVTRNDVLAFLDARATAAPAPAAAVAALPLRAKIAANVLASKQQTADVFSVMEVDMEKVLAVRKVARLTYLPFIARATIDALRAYPAVNARFSDGAVVHNDAVHLGIAVDLDERGLIVPVIRNADSLNVTGLARATAALSSAARAGTIGPDALTGSTFTITNNGAFGTLMTAPIINQPNVAILSTDAVEERVVAINGCIAIRHRMYLCMSWDHRAFDGSTAARFLGRIKRDLEDRDWAGQL